MDNGTHSLVGVFLARSGLNRLAPDATWLLLIAANAPDVDVIAWAGGSAFFLHWHRNFTHSLAFAPVLALLCVAAVRLFTRRRGGWLFAWAICLVGILSHLLLDLTNDYGVRLWLPFSAEWLHWDSTFVIDLWIWIVLLAGFFAPLLSRLVGSEMTSKRVAYPGRIWPILALSFVLVYDAARFLLHDRAIETLNARLYEGETPVRISALASPYNPLSWDGVVETASRAYLFPDMSLGGTFDPAAAKFYFRGWPGAALPALRRDPEFGVLIEFSQLPLWRVEREGEETRYTLTDLRFGNPEEQRFTCSARVSSSLQIADRRCDWTFGSPFGGK